MAEAEKSPAPGSADPALHVLYERWAESMRGGRLPSARDMDVGALMEDHPGAALITVEPRGDGARRYVYSEVGPAHRAALGRDIRGYSIDELVAPQQVAYFESIYDKIVAEARPHYWMRMNTIFGSDLHTFERLIVPVADDGQNVDGLVGIWVWFDERR